MCETSIKKIKIEGKHQESCLSANTKTKLESPSIILRTVFGLCVFSAFCLFASHLAHGKSAIFPQVFSCLKNHDFQ